MPGHEVGGSRMMLRRLRTGIPRRPALCRGWHGDRQPNTCTPFCRTGNRKGAHWNGYGSRCSAHLGRNHREGFSCIGHLAGMAWNSSRIEDPFHSRTDIPKIPHTNRLCPPNRSLAPTPFPHMPRVPVIHFPHLVVRMMSVPARRWSSRMRPACASTPRGGRVRPSTARVGLRLRVRIRVRVCIRTRLKKLDANLAPQRLGPCPHPEALPTRNVLASAFCRTPQRTLPAPAFTPRALTSAAQPTAGKLPPLLPEMVQPLALSNHALHLRPRIRSAW